MDNPIAAAGQAEIVKVSYRDFHRTFQRKQQHIIWLPVKLVEAVEQLPQQGFDSVGVNGGVQLLPVMPDNLLRYGWFVCGMAGLFD